jgi:hypothetical protein
MLYTKRVTLVFLVQFVCTLAFVVYCLLIIINFVEMFQVNLTQLHRKRTNDSWLQARCKEQEFVHHIRHHIDLCETVERDALTNTYLIAMQTALDGLHLCGSYSCEKLFISLTQSFRLSIYTWIVSISIVMVMVPICILPLYRKWQRNLILHENHLGENAMVPSVYVRDRVGSMHDVPYHNMHSFGNHSSNHIISEPRQRKFLGNSNDITANTDSTYMIGTRNGMFEPVNQTRYPSHSHAQ